MKSDPFKIGADGLVLANGDDPEEQVDRRIKRTAEAIHKTMARHRDMNGEVVPTDRPPSVTWGDVFIRDAQVGKDSEIGRYFWQGVRFQYTYLSDSVLRHPRPRDHIGEIMPLKRYIHPKMHFPSVDIPTLTTSDGAHKSQDVVELTDEEFKRLDRFFVFEDVEDGDAPAPKKRGKAKDSQSGGYDRF